MFRFCDICDNILKSNTSTGELLFLCTGCGAEQKSKPRDTLIVEKVLETSESTLKYRDFIKNTPSDPASNKIMEQCEKCKLPYKHMVRIGSQNKIMKLCECMK